MVPPSTFPQEKNEKIMVKKKIKQISEKILFFIVLFSIFFMVDITVNGLVKSQILMARNAVIDKLKPLFMPFSKNIDITSIAYPYF